MSLKAFGTVPLLAAGALCLAGCGLQPRYEAAQGVHDFLAAVQKDDKAAFDAHVDRAKLTSDVRRQLEASAAGEGFSAGGLLGGPAAQAFMDRMISPETFRVVWMRSGVSIRHPPNAIELLPMIRMIGDDRACLRNPRGGHCVLTFQNEGGAWKLVGVRAEFSDDAQPANA